jgi:hypothetical protein
MHAPKNVANMPTTIAKHVQRLAKNAQKLVAAWLYLPNRVKGLNGL